MKHIKRFNSFKVNENFVDSFTKRPVLSLKMASAEDVCDKFITLMKASNDDIKKYIE